MGIPGNANLLLLTEAAGAAPTGYTISRSLRFNSSDSAFLSRTFSAGNRKTFTVSWWAKYTQKTISGSGGYMVFTTGSSTSAYFRIHQNGADFQIDDNNSGMTLQLNDILRDTGAWYHFVLAIDTTQATASDRAKVYKNGELVTLKTATYPTQNADTYCNAAAVHEIGRETARSTFYWDGYFADFQFIDGQALAATDFGEFDDNNVWQPKAYTGSYGTNGFHLDFSDATSTTTIAEDSSGNSNDWTANNISVTAGAGNDSLFDSPTNANAASDTGAGGEVSGNYATLNPLVTTANGDVSLSNGNLLMSKTAASGWSTQVATFPFSSGKWYVEVAASDSLFFGIASTEVNFSINSLQDSSTECGKGYVAFCDNGQTKIDANARQNYSSAAGGTTLGMAVDLDSSSVTWYKNGVSQGALSFSSSNIVGKQAVVFITAYANSSTFTFNFGQRAYSYAAPTGYQPLTTALLDDPTIADGSTAMDVALYTGNGGTQTVTGLGFSPDFVWVKSRSNTVEHAVADTVRGATNTLFPNNTNAEATNNAGDLQSFTSDGFTTSSNARYNESGWTYAAWCWDGGSSTVSNTDGSITSSVRANASAGFSVVTYSGALSGASSSTIGHELGVAPSLVIVKNRDAAENWVVYHQSLGNAAYLILNGSNAQTTGSSMWGTTSPTSTVFTAGYSSQANLSGNDYVAYCWAPVEGYSAFGSYTGNGSSDGPFVYFGFRPKFLLVKNTAAANNWCIIDSVRNTYNIIGQRLFPNLSNVEDTQQAIDFLSNGFKIRNAGSSVFNNSGQVYIYAAFAEHPFKTARAR